MEVGREKCIAENGVHFNQFGFNLLAKTIADYLLKLVI
jgi:hypothetical protein